MPPTVAIDMQNRILNALRDNARIHVWSKSRLLPLSARINHLNLKHHP